MVYTLSVRIKRGNDPIELLGYEIADLNINRAADNTNSTADITFVNPGGSMINKLNADVKQFEETIKFDDLISIAISEKSFDVENPNATEIIFTGLVTDVSGSMDGGSSQLKVTCTDLTDLLLSKAYIGKQYNSTVASDVVENLVQQANDNNDIDKMIKTPNASTLVGGRPNGGFIETTTANITFSTAYKRISELIREVSAPEYTGGSRNATFFIDDDRNFYWWIPENPATSTITSALTASDTTIPVADTSVFNNAGGLVTIGTEVIRYTGISGSNLTVGTVDNRGVSSSIAQSHANGSAVSNVFRIEVPFRGTGIGRVISASFGTNTDDVVNFIIMRLGDDKNGTPIVWYKYNDATTTSKIRQKILDRRDIGDAYYRQLFGDTALVVSDFTSSSTTITLDASASSFPTANGYLSIAGEIIGYSTATPSGSNYDFTGLTRGEFNTPQNENTSADTPAIDWTTVAGTSNPDIRTGIRNAGIAWAESYFGTVREKLEFSVTLEGTKIQPNDLVNLTLEDLGINQAVVRVKNVQHNITRNSWTTQLTLEEDDSEIS